MTADNVMHVEVKQEQLPEIEEIASVMKAETIACRVITNIQVLTKVEGRKTFNCLFLLQIWLLQGICQLAIFPLIKNTATLKKLQDLISHPDLQSLQSQLMMVGMFEGQSSVHWQEERQGQENQGQGK